MTIDLAQFHCQRNQHTPDGRDDDMSDVISFSVRGVPVPQGSMRGFVVQGRAVLTHSDKKTKGWRADVANIAQQHAPAALWDGGASVELRFTLPRPKSVSASKRPLPTSKKSDLDKLVRAVLDALTGIVWRDDSQVVTIVATKRYDDTDAPGLDVRAERI